MPAAMVSPRKQARLSLPLVKRATRSRTKKLSENLDPDQDENVKQISTVCEEVKMIVAKSEPSCASAVSVKKKPARAKKTSKANGKTAEPSPSTLRIDDPVLLAKCRLTTSAASALVGRDAEMTLLRGKIEHALDNRSGTCLYLSGPPGTGKTATVNAVLNQLKASSDRSLISGVVNCVALRSRRALVTRVLSIIEGNRSKKTGDNEERLRMLLTTTAKMVVLVLDEIDHLESHKNETLYSVFDWPSLPQSRLILIGIANSLDLTERLLPRLRTRQLHTQPQLIQYAPYSKDQVADILRHRLLQADTSLAPAAVMMCARKVAAQTGDIRRALDVAKNSLDKLRVARVNAPEDKSVAAPPVDTSAAVEHKENVPAIAPTVPSTPKVGCKEMLESINEVFGSRFNATKSGCHQLPLQQKLLIAGALSVADASGDSVLPLGRVYSAYMRACEAGGVSWVPLHEVQDMCNLLAATGLVAVQREQSTPCGRSGTMTPFRRRNGCGTPRGSSKTRPNVISYSGGKGATNAASGSAIQLLVERATAISAIRDDAVVSAVMGCLGL